MEGLLSDDDGNIAAAMSDAGAFIYLETLDNAAFGAASTVTPKFISHSDLASQWTDTRGGPAYFAYSTNYLIDTDNAVIMDLETTRPIRQAEVGAVKTMIDRVKKVHGLKLSSGLSLHSI